MGHGANTVFTVSFASGATTSGEVNLGRGWHRVYYAPAGAGAESSFKGAPNSGGAAGTYSSVYWPAANSGTAGAAIVGSALSGGIVEVPLGGLQFVKVVTSAAVANGGTVKLIVSDM